MYHQQLAAHRRNFMLLLVISWALLLVGYFNSNVWVLAAGALLVNGYAYYLMQADKRLAKEKGFRVPEMSLFLVAFLGGGIGAFEGMLIQRHKTKHTSFRILLPLFCIAQILLVIWGIQLYLDKNLVS
ncbi:MULTISPECIES: DUF1294 domain-containing protein [Brevibacillus]|uniref:DUF1294 domain-containing protein n=1 Tax=Brevibacillus TaxID=55080 RepID=UPI0002F8397E|nr:MULTISPECIES: DUF1294 domain-containing protein [Brevibacillus]MBH0332335.1 membrane protein [Brevibacillus brevis]NRR02114.1 DUF1294 domain-containing protein [Brevibacillus sp. RS1.1]NRS49828.1 DUF1294 domain-containing protein [Brevibacillus sp. HB2.2]OUQ88704.1 hypothetical protein B5G50_09380 [Brevibacillus brevis]WGV61717.1 DUF1294 domain-containing protein [Brevibacillus brevis]